MLNIRIPPPSPILFHFFISIKQKRCAYAAVMPVNGI